MARIVYGLGLGGLMIVGGFVYGVYEDAANDESDVFAVTDNARTFMHSLPERLFGENYRHTDGIVQAFVDSGMDILSGFVGWGTIIGVGGTDLVRWAVQSASHPVHETSNTIFVPPVPIEGAKRPTPVKAAFLQYRNGYVASPQA